MIETSHMQVDSLKWSASGLEILKGIDVHANSHEFVGILGPNGSGKSSLLRCLFRFIEPDSGVVYLQGKDIREFSSKETAQQIAAVLQERSSEFNNSVFDFVLMGRTPHKNLFDRQNKEDIFYAREALEKVKMSQFAERYIGSLSGGELQRVLLARALCQRAKILILDEPTNHLDIRFQMEMLSLIKGLGITTIAALHELNMAALFCDKVYVISNGRIVAKGMPAEVLTEELIQEVYGVKARVQHDYNAMNIVYLPS